MRRVREDRRELGSFAHLPDLRRYPLLRQFAEQTRHQTRPRERTSRDRLRPARRALALLLSRRRVRSILTWRSNLAPHCHGAASVADDFEAEPFVEPDS